MNARYDLVVIGGGTAGILAARTAAVFGATVALIEADRPGGDCLWTGCVPSKALIAAAGAAHRMRTGGPGVAPAEPKIDFSAVMSHVHAAIAHIEPDDSAQALESAGVEVIAGRAAFTGPREVAVDDRRLPFHHAVIATGTTPYLPPIPGLSDAAPLTSDTIWQLTALPGRMAVLGGGPIGCELGQALARLGTEVTILEAADRLLPREEPEASTNLAARLHSEGVRVLTGATVNGIRGSSAAITVAATAADGAVTAEADRILVATGRRPVTSGLGLDRAGVRTDPRGYVVTDRRLRTSNRHIYAAGDVTGAPAFTHIAAVHGNIAATNAALGPLRSVQHDRMPWVTFTDPEIAHCGLTEAQARERHGSRVQIRRLYHTHLDRAVTEAATDGFTQVILDPSGHVLGATIVAPRAGEMITELARLTASRGRLRELASVVHPYPSWSQAVWTSAVADATSLLTRPSRRAAINQLRRIRHVMT